MNNKRTQTLLKVSCLLLTLIQIRRGNVYNFPTIGFMYMNLVSSSSYLVPAIYFGGLTFLVLALAVNKPQLVKFTFITGFLLLLSEIAIYQFYGLREAYWSGTEVYLWTAIPFILLGMFQIVQMVRKAKNENCCL